MDIDKIREQFDAVARKYDSQRKCFIPCFDDFYTGSVSLLKYYREDFRTIVDLGAGTGLLTKNLYALYPTARYVLVDVSGDMLEIARERFGGLDNFEFVQCDYAAEIPVESCDLICSALSIHHLENDAKEALYRNIYEKLDPGGCFINLDQFNGESRRMNYLYNALWNDYIAHSGLTPQERAAGRERQKLDRENTVPETLELLKRSGFPGAECVYRYMKFGVVMAIK